ncbi:MAG TPA: hypothetical protein VL285_09300 [Bryobacteraceae bacterium]|jgi:hypothetical protein|nr:hypothetical protein [Bryobacteraceae bacterium]
MISTRLYARACTVIAVAGALPFAIRAQSFKLDSAKGLTMHNAVAAPVTFKGKKAIKLTIAPEAAARFAAAAAPAGKKGGQKKGGGPAGDGGRLDTLGIVDGVDFSNGTIELDLTGEPDPGAGAQARGFVGVAFRVQPDRGTYDCFYLRPTNGRADDQERRNHSAQYIRHPDFTWFRMRAETPSRYESYVDIRPAEWIHVKIEVDGDKARLFVDGRDQATLIVNDVKSGASGKGGVALWFEGSTIAHYANLKITPR